jgi:hypothetical protein
MLWDVIVIVALVVTLIALPVDIAFYTQPGEHGGGEQEGGHGGKHADHANATSATEARSHDGGGASSEHGDNAGDDGEVSVFGKKMTRGKYLWFMSNFICEIFFMLDIVLDFRTGYVDDETEEV